MSVDCKWVYLWCYAKRRFIDVMRVKRLCCPLIALDFYNEPRDYLYGKSRLKCSGCVRFVIALSQQLVV